MRVVNQGRIDFHYKLHSYGPMITKTIFSNVVSTDILKDMLKIDKKVDKLVASTLEILIYSITISNMSDININNVFIKDITPLGTKFIWNSLKVNGAKIRCININDGLDIGTISVNQSLQIDFKVIILPGNALCNIKNYSDITYDYIYDVDKPPIIVTKQTNEVLTFVENKLFKQFNISTLLKIPLDMPLIDSIENIKVKINVVNTKVVPANYYCESKLCKLIIIGSIEYNVLYKYNSIKSRKKCIQKLNYIEGFSTFISVPCGIQYCNEDIVKMNIESLSNTLLSEKNLLIDTEILLNI